MRILADSAFVIDYLSGCPEAEARWAAVFADGDEPIVNEIVVCEVAAGLRALRRAPTSRRSWSPSSSSSPGPTPPSWPGAGAPRPAPTGRPSAWPTR